MKQGDTTTQFSGYAITRQLVLEELDMEIHMRERLQETVESRIAWATCLQSSLGTVAEKQGPGAKVGIARSNPFQLAAADALNVAETPLLPILSRQARFSTLPALDAPPPLPVTSSTNPYARPYTRHIRLRRSPSTIRTSPKLLYFRDPSTDAIARLLCPDCSRGDFPRVQSLLNHCRIQHGREFGSHDECIRGCAVQVPADEEAWVVENGTELRQGGLPSLRRLFEIAVGGTGSALEIAPENGASTTQPSASQGDNHVLERVTPPASATSTLSSTHLSRTLGHHADSPALAPFLGRAPKRRGIVAYDENTPVDIDGGVPVEVRSRWHKSFVHRSCARPSLDVAIPTEAPVPQYTNVTPVTQGTRFHIVARVTISDHSLWMPVDRRSTISPNHTHQWLLCIEAPSYSLPLGAILVRATVTSLSPGLASDGPLEMSGPPFFARGTAAHPFLARLRLEWTSESLNPPLEVDHWVELDMLHAGTPVCGDEQVLDVELDRHTLFRPVPKLTQSLDPWNWYCESPRSRVEPAPALPGYVILLRSLVPKFPLTLRDMKSKVSTPLPYKLVSSPAHFRALVPGRRKAMEWARARALRGAYEKLREEMEPGDEYPHLSVGDVFSWLTDTELSRRQVQSTLGNAPSGKKSLERITPSAVDTFCAACGLETARYPSAQTSPWEGPSSGSSCCRPSSMSRFPLYDVGPGQSQPYPNDPVQSTPAKNESFRWSIREVLTATDPALISAVRCIIVPLKLSCFPESQNAPVSGTVLAPNSTAITTMVDGSDDFNRSDFAPTAEQIPESLASSAVLALAVREFARRIMNAAVTAFATERAQVGMRGRAILTPAHVSRGVAGSYLARDGGLALTPVALALATLVRRPAADPLVPSGVMDTSSGDPVSPVHSLFHCAIDEGVNTVGDVDG